MSLVKCPECGRENVSDSAESCPNCGYGIKKHFDQIKRAQEIERNHQMKLNMVKMPEKPKQFNICYKLAIFFAVVAIITIPAYKEASVGIALVLMASAIWMYFEGAKQYARELEKYELSISDPNKYKEIEVINKEIQAYKKDAKTPSCPYCNSKNVVKISMVGKVVKTEALGLVGAMDDAGKTYRCNNCGSKW